MRLSEIRRSAGGQVCGGESDGGEEKVQARGLDVTPAQAVEVLAAR